MYRYLNLGLAVFTMHTQPNAHHDTTNLNQLSMACYEQRKCLLQNLSGAFAHSSAISVTSYFNIAVVNGPLTI